MSRSTFSRSLFALIGRGVGFLFIVTTGLFTALWCQASSSDYRKLFWTVAPIAAIHFLAVAIYFQRVRDLDRWVVLAFGGLAAASFGEMALRIL